jgi:mannose-6-phosphate isomerase-like protein (cupin superfamily)
MNESLRMGTDTVTILTPSTETAGDLFAVEIRMQPGGGPPVMHRHAPSEVYRVLSGQLVFYLDGPGGPVRRTASAGDTVTLPGNIGHTIRNESDEEAVAFSVHAPGAPMEGFTRAVAELGQEGPPSMDEVLAVASKHGIELLGPIPVTTRPG